MKDKIKALYEKHKEFVLYALFGVVTTVASLGAWYLFMSIGGIFWNTADGKTPTWLHVAGSTVQWVVGVIVAFVTNKKWVFLDADKGVGVTVRQFLTFSGSRLLTYFIEIFMNLGLIALMGLLPHKIAGFGIFGLALGDLAAKVLTTVVIVILNYVFSKLIVFRKHKKKKE